MSLCYLLDSVIVIDHLNGIAAATQFLREHGAASAISVITRAEVLAGFHIADRSAVVGLLDAFPSLAITADIADLAAQWRRERRLKLPDALQAAVAERHGLLLVTRNTRDFPAQPGSRVLVPDVI